MTDHFILLEFLKSNAMQLKQPSLYCLPIPLNGLTRLLAYIAPEVTIGDMKEAANTLTIPFEMVVDYIHGKGYDIETTTDLIAFFKRRIDARNE